MKTVIYEPKYLEYPGVSLPTLKFPDYSDLFEDDYSDLFEDDFPELTDELKEDIDKYVLPGIDYSVNPFKGKSFKDYINSIPEAPAKAPTPNLKGTNLKGTNLQAIYLMKRLQSELNLTRELAAGIAGNIFLESLFNPKAVGDGGKAHGIAQWHPDRRRGIDMLKTSYEDLVSYLIKELQSERTFNHYGGLKKLRLLKTASEAAAFIDKAYERSNGAHRTKRQSYAEAYAKLKFLRGGKLC